jgi:hypothetical protein
MFLNIFEAYFKITFVVCFALYSYTQWKIICASVKTFTHFYHTPDSQKAFLLVRINRLALCL